MLYARKKLSWLFSMFLAWIINAVTATTLPLELLSFIDYELIRSSSFLSSYASLIDFCHSYALRAFMVLLMIVMTLFRREMSCNREYVCESNSRYPKRRGETINPGAQVLEMIDDSSISEQIHASVSSVNKDISGDGEIQNEKYNPCTEGGHNEKPIVEGGESTQYQESNSSSSSHHIFGSLEKNNEFFSYVPNDALMHLLSFLHPKDLGVFCCVSHDSNRLASHPLLWKSLLLRDYDYILTKWPFAQEAFQRFNTDSSCSILDYISLCTEKNLKNPPVKNKESLQITMKERYFIFTKCWINWSLAGRNSFECCYIGLHNSIFNITEFIWDHPGSPETILMYAGRDATAIFEDLGHSKGARSLAAKQLCVLNMGYDYYGQQETVAVAPRKNNVAGERVVSLPQMRSRSKRKNPMVLSSIKNKIEKEGKLERARARQWRRSNKDLEILGEINTYYDPFFLKWRWWYSDWNMNPVFMNSMD